MTKIQITGCNGVRRNVITKPRSLEGAAKRLRKDGENWYRWGWDDIVLEVDDGTSGGWRPLFRDEIPQGMDRELRDELRALAIPRLLPNETLLDL